MIVLRESKIISLPVVVIPFLNMSFTRLLETEFPSDSNYGFIPKNQVPPACSATVSLGLKIEQTHPLDRIGLTELTRVCVGLAPLHQPSLEGQSHRMVA